MKKIGLISTYKLLAQSLAEVIKNYPDLEFEPCLLINPKQVILDAEIQGIEIAVIDMAWSADEEPKSVLSLCERLHKEIPNGKLLLVVPQDDAPLQDMAMRIIKNKTADDYVFFDVSLDYLLAKLLAL